MPGAGRKPSALDAPDVPLGIVERLTAAIACVNACAGIDDPEKWINSARFYSHETVSAIVKQRDDLLAALKKLTDVFANIGITSGLYDDEQDALKSACAAIASVKELK